MSYIPISPPPRVAAHRARLHAGLICLRDAPQDTLELLIGDRRPDRGEVQVRMCRPWAHSSRRDGFWFEPVTTWRGWDCKPRQCITWTELDTLIDQDPRLDDLATWSTNLTAIDAWKDRTRPFELWLDADRWHPSWIDGDHARPGWPQRLQAWETTITILNDTIGKLP